MEKDLNMWQTCCEKANQSLLKTAEEMCVLYMASDMWCDYAYYRIIPSLALYVDGC